MSSGWPGQGAERATPWEVRRKGGEHGANGSVSSSDCREAYVFAFLRSILKFEDSEFVRRGRLESAMLERAHQGTIVPSKQNALPFGKRDSKALPQRGWSKPKP